MSAFVRPPGRAVEDRIEIAAGPATIWSYLAAVDEWSGWNPLYAEAGGSLAVGGRIDFAVVLEGMKPQRASATVQIVRPAELLQYRTSNLGGLVRATRYVVLTPSDGGGTAVLNGEAMDGPVGRILARVVGEKVRRGLAAMNHGLKKVAEKGE